MRRAWTGDRYVPNLAAGRRINHGQRAAAVSNEDSLICRINANIVGVAAELNPVRGIVVPSFKQSHRTVTGIGDIERIGRGLVADTLRFFQPSNCANQFAIGEIDNSQGIVAQFGNEQSLPLQINRHVIDAAAHLAQRDFGLELERACIR